MPVPRAAVGRGRPPRIARGRATPTHRVTVYHPDLDRFEPDLKTRRKK
jgi:hypothetical protein